MKSYIGIDPGKSGALAVLQDNRFVQVIPFSAAAYVAVLRAYQKQDVVCCVEKVGARPGQGVTSMFNFGHNAGFIEGVLQSFSIPYQLVPPQTWKKEFSLSSDKAQSIEVCLKLFPDADLLTSPRSRKPNDGMAEAVLLAEYARRKL